MTKDQRAPPKSKGKVGYPWESTRDIYQHIPPIYGLYNGCIGQYGVMFWEQLLGYPPFPLTKSKLKHLFPTRVSMEVIVTS